MARPPRYLPGSTLKRPEKEMRRFNPERRARREAEGRVYGELHQWTKRQPCILAGHADHTCQFYADRKGVESHHVKSIGSGGEDENNTLSCCPGLHDSFHRLGLTRMCEVHGMDFRSLACEYTAQFYREQRQEEE